MITVTEGAQKELDSFFSTHPDTKKSVRVYLTAGGCGGPRLTMALDDPNEQDMSEQVNGITYCMSGLLAMQTGEVTVDVSYMGFALTPEHPMQFQGGSCGGGCSSCGSGSCGC